MVTMRDLLPALAGTSASVAATAVAGAAASAEVRSGWYAALDKPSYQPPGEVFPVAWTALYADIAVTSALTLAELRRQGRADEAARFAAALAANLGANGGWSWVFFRWHRLASAAGVAALLAVSSADLVRRAGRVSPAAAAALAAYPAWCGFATVLSTAIWRRNR
jgi:tryptophan-rich sensory protein